MKSQDLIEVESEIRLNPWIPRSEWRIQNWIPSGLKNYAQIPFFLTKKHSRPHEPNRTWKTGELHNVGDRAVTLLALKAAKGDADAAEKLALVARRATAFLTEVCESKPDLLRPLARRARDWPVIKKNREELSGPEKKLFKGIELGAGDFIENDAQTTKWQLDDAGKIAYSLIVFIRNARTGSADSMIDRVTHGRIKPEKIMLGLVPDHRRGALSQIRKLATKTLRKDIDKENAETWWAFAKEHVLLRNYPDLLQVPEFDALVPKTCIKTDKPLFPSTREQKILRKIKARFLSFARNSCFD